MPMIIPVVMAFAGAAAGVGATYLTVLSVAGAVLSTVGAVTGKKDLMKIGAVLSLGGAIGSGLAGAGVGAASSEAAGEAAGQAAANEASIAAGSGALNGAAENVALANNAANTAAQTSSQLGTTTLAADLGASGDMLGMAGQRAAVGSLDGLSTSSTSLSGAVPYGQAGTPLATGGQAFATDSTGTMGAMDWLNKAGSVVRNNKELFSIGGQMLQGMFGPEAELLDLKKQEMERRRRNANAIVPLGQLGMIGTTLGKG